MPSSFVTIWREEKGIKWDQSIIVIVTTLCTVLPTSLAHREIHQQRMVKRVGNVQRMVQ